jgi:hypothetical protein
VRVEEPTQHRRKKMALTEKQKKRIDWLNQMLTPEQRQAILYAYLDVTAVSKIVGDEDNWDWRVIAELGNATKETKVDLEREFPFLLEDNGELI